MKKLRLICVAVVFAQTLFGAKLPANLEKYSKVSFNFNYPDDCRELDCIRLEVTNESGEELIVDQELIKRSLIVTFLIRYENYLGEVKSKGFTMSYPVSTASYNHGGNHTHVNEHGGHHSGNQHTFNLNDTGNIDIDFLQLVESTFERFKKDMPNDFKRIDSVRVISLLRNPFSEIRKSEGVEMDYATKGFDLSLDMVKRAFEHEVLF
jgi:hypothetical protein